MIVMGIENRTVIGIENTTVIGIDTYNVIAGAEIEIGEVEKGIGIGIGEAVCIEKEILTVVKLLYATTAKGEAAIQLHLRPGHRVVTPNLRF